jgi:hypothetical protein
MKFEYDGKQIKARIAIDKLEGPLVGIYECGDWELEMPL